MDKITEYKEITNQKLDLENIVPLLHQIANFIDDAIENGEDEDKISNIIELMKGIADDNWMYIRNN